MASSKIYAVALTKSELQAAFIACSNYTGTQGDWKQKSQAKAAAKLEKAYINEELG